MNQTRVYEKYQTVSKSEDDLDSRKLTVKKVETRTGFIIIILIFAATLSSIPCSLAQVYGELLF